jgi:hypothetical protein
MKKNLVVKWAIIFLWGCKCGDMDLRVGVRCKSDEQALEIKYSVRNPNK